MITQVITKKHHLKLNEWVNNILTELLNTRHLMSYSNLQGRCTFGVSIRKNTETHLNADQ